jgi:hypothetical protein
MCSNYANHPSFNGQHDWGDIYDQLMATRMFTLIMDKIFISGLKIVREVTTTLIWICLPSCTNRMVHILGEVG